MITIIFKRIKKRSQPVNDYNILQARLLTVQDQMTNFKETSMHYQHEFSQLSKRITCFCRALLNSEFAPEEKVKISDMDAFTLLDFMDQTIKEKNIKEKDILLELSDVIKTKSQEIESLKIQISHLLMRDQQIKDFDIPEKPKEEPKEEKIIQGVPRVSIIEDDDEEDSDKKKLKLAESLITIDSEDKNTQLMEKLKEELKVRTEQAQSQEVMAHVVNLNDYLNKITDTMWDILAALGKGLSESKDLKKIIVKNSVNDSAFNTSLIQLRKMNVIEQAKINTGWRWFNTYEITSFGKRIYYEKFKENPLEGEKAILQKEHTTAMHGYCIKDTAYILQAVFGYDSVSITKKENTTKLMNGEVYIPDIIAKKKQGSIVDYIEVELGNHTQKDFNHKCEKMRMVAKDLYFVVPDADTMNKILTRQISQWVLEKGGKEKLKGTTIYLTTTTKLNESKWEIIYNF